ncbi:MAG: polysaccharide biosynthesis C-terminal domain-containing protein [Porcipelethomonas sp.]
MKKQSFVKGSVILIASAVISKAVGALFKIPLTNMLGGTGMSYFSSAYGLFLPIYAVTANGLTTAVAKLTAESCAFGNYSNIKKIHRISLIIFSAAGLAGTILTAVLAVPFSEKAAACPGAWLSVLMIAPSVLLGCITAVYRGCREGMSNMYPTAVSQVIESLVRLAAGLGLCSFVLNNPEKVLSFLPEGTDLISAAAAAAVLGISLSTLAGTLFMYIGGTGCEKYSSEGKAESGRKIAGDIFRIFIPVALGAAVTNLTSVVDLTTIVRCLGRAADSDPEYFNKIFSLPDSVNAPEFIYGSFNGLAITIFNLIPSVTNMFGKGILPCISESFARNDRSAVKRLSENVIKATAFIAIPSGLGIFALAGPILNFLFPERTAECAVSARSLAILGIAVIFLSLSFPLFSCFQAAGKADAPVKLMLAGVAVKLSGNLLLIPIPEINISGAAISTLLCYFVIFLLSLIFYIRVTGVKPDILRCLVPPLFSGIMCAVTAWLVYSNLPFRNAISLPAAVIAGGIIYLAASALTGNIPVGRKFRNTNK